MAWLKYKIVRSAKMNAWIAPMNISKSFQMKSGAQMMKIGSLEISSTQHRTGEDVAEKSKRQRDRLDQLFEDVDRQQRQVRLFEVR